jgi:RNA polymerase sigma factor (sigma-70 family)
MEPDPREPDQPSAAAGGAFAHTRWSVVLTAGQGSGDSAAALEKLCRAYWPPVNAHVRRQGYDVHEAEDLTQEFFARLLADDSLASVAPHKGRFRAWLLAALRNFLINEWKRATARKRGGGMAVLSLDAMEPGQREACEPGDSETPDTVFERRWAETLLTRANARLRHEYEAAGQGARFDALKTYLLQGDASVPYGTTARLLGISEGAVRSAIYKLRQRYGAVVRAEVAATVDREDEVDDEMRHLLAVLRSSGGNYRP